jgi:hypothetical protein
MEKLLEKYNFNLDQVEQKGKNTIKLFKDVPRDPLFPVSQKLGDFEDKTEHKINAETFLALLTNEGLFPVSHSNTQKGNIIHILCPRVLGLKALEKIAQNQAGGSNQVITGTQEFHNELSSTSNQVGYLGLFCVQPQRGMKTSVVSNDALLQSMINDAQEEGKLQEVLESLILLRYFRCTINSGGSNDNGIVSENQINVVGAINDDSSVITIFAHPERTKAPEFEEVKGILQDYERLNRQDSSAKEIASPDFTSPKWASELFSEENIFAILSKYTNNANGANNLHKRIEQALTYFINYTNEKGQDLDMTVPQQPGDVLIIPNKGNLHAKYSSPEAQKHETAMNTLAGLLVEIINNTVDDKENVITDDIIQRFRGVLDEYGDYIPKDVKAKIEGIMDSGAGQEIKQDDIDNALVEENPRVLLRIYCKQMPEEMQSILDQIKQDVGKIDMTPEQDWLKTWLKSIAKYVDEKKETFIQTIDQYINPELILAGQQHLNQNNTR